MITIHKSPENLIEIRDDQSPGLVVRLNRGAAKAVARFLLIELNVFEAYAKEGPDETPKILKIHEIDEIYKQMIKKRWPNG